MQGMNILYAICFLVISNNAQSIHNDCQDRLQLLISKGFVDSGFNRPCLTDPCNSSSLPFNTTGNDCPPHCGTVNGKCLPKVLRYVDIDSPTTEQTALLFKNAAQTNMASFTASVNPRSFFQTSGGSSSSGAAEDHLLQDYGCIISGLAVNCNLDFSNLELLSDLIKPPVNIPYCLRIPCNTSNAMVERDLFTCQSNPGCYFDQELAYRRNGFTIAALPGVPVCYQAIQNNKFLRLAQTFNEITNQPWNPLYTRCLIRQIMPALREPLPGCYVLKMLHSVDIQPKIAGWKEITEIDCILINGCYFPEFNYNGYNCFYPARINPNFVRDDDSNEDQHGAKDIYGRHICQLFKKDTSESYLNSYHQCKLSGCTVDESVTSQKLYNQFLNIMLSKKVGISAHARPYFWHQVKSGIITPGNWKEKLKKEQPCDILKTQNPDPFHNSFLLTYSQDIFRAGVLARQSEGLTTTSRNFNLSPNPRAFPINPCDILSSNINNLTPISYPSTVPPTPGIIPFVFQYPFSGIQQPINPTVSVTVDQGSRHSGVNVITPNRSIAPQEVLSSMIPQGTSLSSNSFINLLRQGSISNRLVTNINLQNNHLLGLLCRRAHLSPGCPYQDLNFENYPPLKGSFKECCERHLCYIKKKNIFQQHSGPQNYWNRFGEWSSCNAACGGGSRRRTRVCEMFFPNSPSCHGSPYQIEICNSQECAFWSSWGEYGQCSTTCGSGVQVRKRTCTDGNEIKLIESCKGRSTKSKQCNLGSCPTYGPWSTYEECDCGRGVQKRQRRCIGNCNQAESIKYDERPCERFCGTARILDEGPCDQSTCSKVINYYECHLQSSNETPHCFNFIPQRTVLCFTTWPCFYCPRTFSLQQCQAYLRIG